MIKSLLHLGNSLSKVFVLMRIYLLMISFGMTLHRKTLECCSKKQKEVEDLVLVRRMGKGNKKEHKKGKKEDSNRGKKDLSNVKCLRCHQKGHYASQCLERKKGKAKPEKQVERSTSTIARVDDLSF
jgi:hypothetical protein